MNFPSDEWIEQYQERCNDDEHFNRVSEWSDVNLVLEIAEDRYWMKLYGGEIIDVMKYEPMSNPLGYDVIISGSVDAWEDIRAAEMPVWDALRTGELTIEGNLLEANRMHDAIVRMCELMGENQIVEVDA